MKVFSTFTCFILVSFWSLVPTIVVGATTGIKTTPEPEPAIRASICPNASTISPCTCMGWVGGIDLQCSGLVVDQTSLPNLFRELRRVNGIPEDRGVVILRFAFSFTQLTLLDLAPFLGSQMDTLSIYGNTNLTQLVTSGTGNPGDHRSIHVKEFALADSHLNRQGFGDTLKYFSSEMTVLSAATLDLSLKNNNNDNTDEGEFLPGLSALTNLTSFRFFNSNISGRLNSSDFNFKNFPKLESISLAYNEIDGIGENVFNSDAQQIFLIRNKLDETSFHPESGIAGTYPSGKEIWLQENQITSLPTPIFQTFLDAHPENALHLLDNPLICDKRLSWLKSRRDEFQERVWDANCENDPGHTVFNSTLIP